MFRATGLTIVLVLSSVAGLAQTGARVSTALSARVPSSVALSVSSAPVLLSVQSSDRVPTEFTLPMHVKWNLNPAEVRGFEIVAYFSDPSSALTHDSQPVSLPASSLLARLGEGDFKPFSPADGRLSVSNVSAANDGRRGERLQLLELKGSSELTVIPQGDYRGVLYLEVREY